MLPKERTWWHEMGHFVATELNRLYYSGYGAARIDIYKCGHDNMEFCGRATPIVPDHVNHNSPTPIGRLPMVLAKIKYGTIFQSYFTDSPLVDCIDENGVDDKESWENELKAKNKFDLNDEVTTIDEEHVKYLRDNNVLEAFKELNPDDYLVEIGEGHFAIDGARMYSLKADTLDMIQRMLERPYKDLIEKYKACLLPNDELTYVLN